MSALPVAADAAQRMHGDLARIAGAAQRFDVRYLDRVVCWRRWGHGPALVLIHGGHGNWMHWIRNIETLADRHTVWVPDMPGFGDSDDLGGEPHAPDRKRQLLDALCTTLDTLIGRGSAIDVAGFSFGGLIASEMAVARGGVRRLALLGAAGHGGARRVHPELKDWRAAQPGQRLAAHRQNLAAFMLHRPASVDALALEVHHRASDRTRFRSKAISRAGGLKACLDQFGGPLLLVWGAHDVTAIPEVIAPVLAGNDVHRDWCVIPEAGHWVQFEAADDVNKLLRSWFVAEEGDMQ